jgi:hypothetical protein
MKDVSVIDIDRRCPCFKLSVIATGAVDLSECDIDADANGAWAKRSHLVALFKVERIAEGEAVAAYIEEIVDVHS